MSYGPPPQPPGFGPPPPGYGPPPPQPPGWAMPQILLPPGQFVQPARTNGLAIASLVCGILAIVPGCCCGLFGIPLSVIAVVTGLVGISQINASQGRFVGKGLAIVGTTCGGVAIALDVLSVMFNVTQQVTRSMHV